MKAFIRLLALACLVASPALLRADDSVPVTQALVSMQSAFILDGSLPLGDVSPIPHQPTPEAMNRAIVRFNVVTPTGIQTVDESGLAARFQVPAPFCTLMFLNADRMLTDDQFHQIGIPRPTDLPAGQRWLVDRGQAVQASFVAQGTSLKPYYWMDVKAPFATEVLEIGLRLFDGIAAPKLYCVIPAASAKTPTLGELRKLLEKSLQIQP